LKSERSAGAALEQSDIPALGVIVGRDKCESATEEIGQGKGEEGRRTARRECARDDGASSFVRGKNIGDEDTAVDRNQDEDDDEELERLVDRAKLRERGNFSSVSCRGSEGLTKRAVTEKGSRQIGTVR